MIWYKHDTNATTDAKMRKLTMRYGAEGYAIYFHCLELIAADINENNITFELEHDSEIIADNLKIKSTPDCAAIDKVNEIMTYIVELGLFQESQGRIFCFKLLKRLDTSMTSSKKFRELISKAKDNHDKVMINHDGVMQDKKRVEESRKEKIIIDDEFKESFEKFWILYDKKKSKQKCLNKWSKIQKELYNSILEHVKIYVESTPDKQYRKDPCTYLNNESWNDEIIKCEIKEEKKPYVSPVWELDNE